jgi:hypothetical protein
VRKWRDVVIYRLVAERSRTAALQITAEPSESVVGTRLKVNLGGAMAVRFAFDDRYRVLIAQFSGLHVPEDIAEIHRVTLEFVAWKGPVHCLLDYTSVEAVAVPRSLVVHRACQPQIAPGCERVFVVPTPELYELARIYASVQHDFGNKELHVVHSLEDAYKLLRLEQPNFRPIAQRSS